MLGLESVCLFLLITSPRGGGCAEDLRPPLRKCSCLRHSCLFTAPWLGCLRLLIWPKHNCTFSAALAQTSDCCKGNKTHHAIISCATMAELSQLSFIACKVIAVTGLRVVATITNGLMRLRMTRSNNMTWKPLCEVREASWKRKRQGDRLLSTRELKWKNKSVLEFMEGAQRVQSKAMRFSGR